MAQLQTEVPHPLRDDLPALLTPGGLTTPAIRVLNSKPLRNIASLTIVFKPF
jgi:hypothetical protein